MKKQKDPSLMTDKELIIYSRTIDNDEELQKRLPNIDINNMKLKDIDMIYLIISIKKYEKNNNTSLDSLNKSIQEKYSKKYLNDINKILTNLFKNNSKNVIKALKKENFKEAFLDNVKASYGIDYAFDMKCIVYNDNDKLLNYLMNEERFQEKLLRVFKNKPNDSSDFYIYTSINTILKARPEIISFIAESIEYTFSFSDKVKMKYREKNSSVLKKYYANKLDLEQINEIEELLYTDNKEKYPVALKHSLLDLCSKKEKMYDYYKRLETLVFDGDFKKTVSFCKSYYDQPLFDSIMSLDDSKLVSLKEKLDILSKHNRLENMHNISDLEEKKVEEIKELKYDENYKNSTNIQHDLSASSGKILFNYLKEIMVINDNGKLFDIDGGNDHTYSYINFCKTNKIDYPTESPNEYSIASHLGGKGLSTIIISNEDVLIILSSTAPDEIKQKIIDLLTTIQVPEASVVIAQVVDTEGNVNDFNDGELMPISDAIEVLTKLKKEKGKRL